MRQFVDMFQRAGVVLSNFGLNFLALINFSTDDAAPIASPYAGEIGSLDTIIDTANALSVSSGRLQCGTASGADNPRLYTSTSYARVVGRTMLIRYNKLTGNMLWALGFNNVTTGRPSAAAMFVNNADVGVANGSPSLAFALSNNTDYEFAIRLRSSGFDVYGRGGAVTNWRLLFIHAAQTTTPMFAGLGAASASGGGQFDNFRVVDLPAPFNSDYGIALVNVTSFTQSLGAELLTNGDFSAWTGGNPTGWTVTGESGSDPEVSETASNAGHGGGGTGAANFFSSATTSAPQLSQTILTAGHIYEITYGVTNRVAGAVRAEAANINGASVSALTNVSELLTSDATNFKLRGIGVAPIDVTTDNVSVKRVTTNAQETAFADGIFDFEYTRPSSPLPGMRVELRYRIVDSLNYWVAYILFNDIGTNWNFRLDSVVAGTPTNRMNVSAIGITKRIQVRAIGDLHNCYTFDASEIPTKRGSEINISTHNTATGLNTVYSTGTTPIRLTAYAVEHVWYNLLDRAMTPNAV